MIDRLKELADELADEFSWSSPNYWARHHAVHDAVLSINREFASNRAQILAQGTFRGGMKHAEDMRRIGDMLRRLRTDPFVPGAIRAPVAELLERRFTAFLTIRMEELQKYRDTLAAGSRGSAEELEDNLGWVSNRINDRMYREGVGISQVEQAVDKVRSEIQRYLEAFNPLAGRRGVGLGSAVSPPGTARRLLLKAFGRRAPRID